MTNEKVSKRWHLLAALSSGLMLESSCGVTEEVFATLLSVWQIVDIWV